MEKSGSSDGSDASKPTQYCTDRATDASDASKVILFCIINPIYGDLFLYTSLPIHIKISEKRPKRPSYCERFQCLAERCRSPMPRR